MAIIDKQNNTVIPFEYDWSVDHGNFIEVTIGYSPLWSTNSDFGSGKNGLIDKKGNIILPVIYDEIYLCEDKIILVKEGKNVDLQ